jgi:uncharacterized protein YqjF (DUF2071 family)
MDQHDFNRAILTETEHRPWRIPDEPWVMTQTWHDLLFAHWPVDAGRLALKIPAGLELDLFDGTAWVGIVPFHMTNVAPRSVPALPWVSAFPELNVRTYVTYGGKAGVYFFSLDAGNPVAVGVARWMFHLPYFLASMSVEARAGEIDYSSRRTGENAADARFIATYRPIGATFQAAEGTLDYFLTERYCLYTTDSGRILRLNIHHPPWPLQVAEATLKANTMAEVNGLVLPDMAPRLHFARRQDMVAWLPERLTS